MPRQPGPSDASVGSIRIKQEVTLYLAKPRGIGPQPIGSIIEGPSTWTVRPVAEFFYENEFGKSETISGLIDLIWRVRDNLSFDIGLRHAVTNGHPVNEVRAGLTFGFPLQMFGDRPLESR